MILKSEYYKNYMPFKKELSYNEKKSDHGVVYFWKV